MINRVNTARYTLLYVIALSIIATLSVVSHILLGVSLKRNEGFAHLINISGRQRMYSQRINALAAQYKLGDQQVVPLLKQTIRAFEKANQAIKQNILQNRTASAEYKKLDALFREGTLSIDRNLSLFVRDARAIARSPSPNQISDQQLNELFALGNQPLLQQLDHVVMQFQIESENRLHSIQVVQWLILSIILTTLLIEAIFLFRPMVVRLIRFTEELLRLATRDTLTGLLNRGYFVERSEYMVKHAQRSHQAISVLLIDLDHFKQINDTYGHSVGDEALKKIATLISANLRPLDIAGRMGGDELTILLMDADTDIASVVAERLREAVESNTISVDENPITITVSIGISAISTSLDDALRNADQALYEAKRTGRNCIRVADKSTPAAQS